jgi:hypothetical protein
MQEANINGPPCFVAISSLGRTGGVIIVPKRRGQRAVRLIIAPLPTRFKPCPLPSSPGTVATEHHKSLG